MLKKHIVPFAVVATLFILAKVFAYQMPLAQKSLLKEEKLLSIPDLLKGQLSDKEITGVKEYLKEFFDILKNDDLFKDDILDRCRNIN